MSEPVVAESPAAPSAARVVELADRWREALRRISDDDELADAQGLLAEALGEGATGDMYRSTGEALKALAGEAERVAAAGGRLLRHFETLRGSWERTQRFSPARVEELQRELHRRAQRRPARAAKQWLAEVLAAIEQRHDTGMVRVAAIDVPLPDALEPGVRDIRAAVERAAGGDRGALIPVLIAVAEAQLDGWQGTLDDTLRSTAHRLSAWLNIDVRGDIDGARHHLDAAITLQPLDSRAYVERSSMYRIAGESDLAAWDAQRVLELEPASARGLLALGACSEATGDFEQADLLYGQALDRLATWDATTLRGDALLDVPSGRLLIRAARRMLAVRRPRSALAIVDAALRSEIRGPGHYPEAEAYEVRADALERLEPVPREDVSAAALEAGRRYVWDGREDLAVPLLRRAKHHSSGADVAGWLLADALVSMQDPDAPDPEITKEALDVWTEWRKSYGPPEGAMAWAYVTRALIEEDLGRQAGPGDREHSWEALGNVERALVEDDGHALRWALRARYTQELGLLKIAEEALDRGALRAADLPEIRMEQVRLLAALGRLDEADRAVADIAERLGPHEALTAIRAYIAHLLGRDRDAIRLIETALRERDAADYRLLLANFRLGAGDLGAARRAYAAVLDAPSATPQQLRLASFAAGEPLPDPAPVSEESGDLDWEGLATEALIAYAERDADQGSALLAQAIAATMAPLDLHELEHEFPLMLRLVSDEAARGAAEAEALALLEREAPARKTELLAPWLTADAELRESRERADVARKGGVTSVAPEVTRALEAHRLQDRGELDAAASVYDELLPTPLGRMARIALGRVLVRRSDELAAARPPDLDRLEQVQARLLALGAARPVDCVLAVAPVLVALGRADEAGARLRQTLAADADGSEDRERLLQAIGEAGLVAGDLAGARQAFEEAAEIALAERRHARAAQQYVRLGIAEQLGGGVVAAGAAVARALAAWRRADAFEPEWLLMQELHELARGVLPPKVRAVLDPLLEAAGFDRRRLPEGAPGNDRDDQDRSRRDP